MNIVNYGSNFTVYGEDVHTYKELPAYSYNVNFSSNSGFFLTKRLDLKANEEKVYGSHERRVRKVLNSFKIFERNLGLILSGQKGAGKSLFARLLAEQAIENGYPVIIVNNYIPGIDAFLMSITQEVVIIFDEFEKNFNKASRDDNHNPQEDMLSLFDGMDNGKKLFVITCNDTANLSSYMINRPGRFHYHFTIGAPEEEEIKEYLFDNLNEAAYKEIESIVRFSHTANITYDLLRAIVFELNQGETFQNALNDLNINRTGSVYFDIEIYTNLGEVFKTYHHSIDLYSDENNVIYIRNLRETDFTNKTSQWIDAEVNINCVEHTRDGLRIDGSQVHTSIDSDDYFTMTEAEVKIAKEKSEKRKVEYMLLKRCDVYCNNKYGVV